MKDDGFNDVTPNHVHAALILKNISPCALKKFAATMRMSRAAASALVDRMVRAGIVQRAANPEFSALFMGSLGMFLISFEKVSGLISCLGIMQIVVGIVCGGLWLMLRHRPMIRKPG